MKHILLTCDTEVGELTAKQPEMFDIFVNGKLKGEEVGVRLINRIAVQHGAVVEHFVDIYPFQQYGCKRFGLLCEEILANGHRIGLHTHPSSQFDPNRKFMHQYSLAEQKQIIAFGKEQLYLLTQQETFTHRCGGYGMDRNTLIALCHNGISIDSSFFQGNPNCLYASQTVNAPYGDAEIFEVPITVFRQASPTHFFANKRANFIKLDFRYGATVEEILQAIQLAPAEAVIILFLHSFNFLNLPYHRRQKRYGEITVNYPLISAYERLLAEVKQLDGCQFSNFATIDRKKIYSDYNITLSTPTSLWGTFRTKIQHFSPWIMA